MPIHELFSEEELEILRVRAERAASGSQKSQKEETLTVLQITLGGELYALPVTFLRAVYEKVIVVPVPCTPQYVAGIANIRGRIMPVLDLAVLLNALRPKNDANTSLAVISKGDINVAFWVEEVGEIRTFPVSSIGSLPAGGETLERSAYLQGMLMEGSTLLNVNAILDDPMLVVNDILA